MTKEEILIDRLGNLCDDLHTQARSLAQLRWKPDEMKALREAADYISEIRKDIQRGQGRS